MIILVVLVVAVVALVGYLGACALYPFIDCKKCDGTGQQKRWFGLSTQPCQYCGGDGEVARSGAYFMNAMRTPQP